MIIEYPYIVEVTAPESTKDSVLRSFTRRPMIDRGGESGVSRWVQYGFQKRHAALSFAKRIQSVLGDQVIDARVFKTKLKIYEEHVLISQDE